MRAETGPMRFGDDWRGVFIRGDNASTYAEMLKLVLSERMEAITHTILLSLACDLDSAHEDSRTSDDASPERSRREQQMKAFEECVRISENKDVALDA